MPLIIEDSDRLFKELGFPVFDLVGMEIISDCQFGQTFLVIKQFQDDFCLKGTGVGFPFPHRDKLSFTVVLVWCN
jgi:hypothetical protein